MQLSVSRAAEMVELLEGDKWDPQLDSLPTKLSARRVLPAGKSIRIHLGNGLHHGSELSGPKPVSDLRVFDGTSFTVLWAHEQGLMKSTARERSLYYRLRNRTIELTGPLTVRELLQAIGDAQLFECVRNEVLTTWLGRHAEDDSDDDGDEKRPVDCIPLNPEFVDQFEGEEYVVYVEDGTTGAFALPPASVSVLDPPVDVDPTAGMDLQALMKLLGGEKQAIDWVLGRGSTWFLGLELTAECGPADGCHEEWTVVWGEPFE